MACAGMVIKNCGALKNKYQQRKQSEAVGLKMAALMAFMMLAVLAMPASGKLILLQLHHTCMTVCYEQMWYT